MASQSVPEPDVPVRRAAPAGQEAVVVGRPGDGLDSSHVVAVGLHGSRLGAAPNEQFVVVAAAGEVLVVRGPLESAHLLPVSHQPPLRVDPRGPHVSLQDQPVPAARAESVARPGQSSHPGAVAGQRVDPLVGRHVPDLHKPAVCPHRHLVPPLGPADGGDGVVLVGEITEAGHLAGEGGPEVDTGAQPHTQHVLAAPVD